ncbi:MAG: site-specific DNA-methyltransferase [Odoribacter sp.]|nr:site-specific DNA-methyltransferase [Odoribacter sp.]
MGKIEPEKIIKIKDSIIFNHNSNDMSEVPDGSVNLIITSPPYWTLKDYDVEGQIGAGSNSYDFYIEELNKVWKECVRVLAPDGKICINIMPFLLTGKAARFDRRETRLVLGDIEKFMDSTGCMFQFGLYIWDKRKIARFSSFGSYPYPPNIFSTYPYEWITVFSKAGKRKPVSKEIKEKSKLTTEEWQKWAINSIWEMQPAKAKAEGHPAPFPLELPRRLIKLYSFWGDTVLDPFAGTGTTLCAAQQLGRKSIGFELNPDYIPLIKRKIMTVNTSPCLFDQ